MKNMKPKVLMPLLGLAIVFAIGSCSKEELMDSDSRYSDRLEQEGSHFQDRAPLNNSYGQGPGNAGQNKLHAMIRQATVKYQDFAVAEADGYVLNPECVPNMGFHAVNMGLVLDIEPDPLKPEVLVYEAMPNGELKLVAVEYLIPAHNLYDEFDNPLLPFPAFWDYVYDDPPMIGNKEFDDHRDFVTMGGPPFPHYQLHIWLWKSNPDGIYKAHNPNVSCEYAHFFEHSE